VVDGTGGVIREAYLWQLRTGRAINPSYKVIAALAGYFHVNPAYFFGEEEQDDLTKLVDGLNEHERRIVQRIAINLLVHT
jgi:transcriptional regulator with XRE-family HTH domain